MLKKRLRVGLVGALALSSGAGASALTGSSAGNRAIAGYKADYMAAMKHASTQAQREMLRNGTKFNTKNTTNLSDEDAFDLYRPSDDFWGDYFDSSIRNKYSTPSSSDALLPVKSRYETSYAKSVAAKWARQGVMPQEVMDSVLATQIPSLQEFDVFAHGSLVASRGAYAQFAVPPETVVVFWNIPGTLTTVVNPSIGNRRVKLASALTGLQPIPNKSVTNRVKAGNATGRRGAYAVMHVGGDIIPEVSLSFQDPSLPMGVFKDGVRNASKVEHKRLSQFLRESGPGVYYVLSCRPADYRASTNNLEILKDRNRRARERLRPTSNPRYFDKFNSAIHKYVQRTFSMEHASTVLAGMSPAVPITVLLLAIKAMTDKTMPGSTGMFVKGGSLREMAWLIAHAVGGPVPLSTFATGHAWKIASTLALARILNYRKRTAARIRALRAKLADPKTWFRASKQKELDRRVLLRKYGFDTRDPLQLQRLYALHEKRLLLRGNRTAMNEMRKAHAMAVSSVSRPSVPVAVAAGAISRAPIPRGQLSINPRRARQFMATWGFKPGMTRNAIEKTAAKALGQWSVWNRVAGRVPKELALAKNMAIKASTP